MFSARTREEGFVRIIIRLISVDNVPYKYEESVQTMYTVVYNVLPSRVMVYLLV